MQRLFGVLATMALFCCGEVHASATVHFSKTAAIPSPALHPSTSNIAVLLVHLAVSADGGATLTSVTLELHGAAVLSGEIDELRIYDEAAGLGALGQYDGTEGLPLVTRSILPGENSITLALSRAYPPNSTGDLLVVVRTTANTRVGDDFALALTGVTFAGDRGTLADGLPLTSERMVFWGLSVSRGAASPAGAEIGINSLVPVLQLQFAATGEAIAVSRITVSSSGTAVLSYETDEVRLYRDVNGNGVVDESDGVPIGAQSFTEGSRSVTFDGLGFTVPASGESGYLLAAIVTNGNGVSGRTLALAVNAETDIIHTGAAISVASAVLTSDVMVFPTGQVTVTGTSIVPITLRRAQRDVPILRLDCATAGPAVVLKSLRVDNNFNGGTGLHDAEDIVTAKIYRDADRNGAFSTASDLLIATTPITGADGGSGTFAWSVPDTLRENDGSAYFLAYDLADKAVSALHLGAYMADSAYMSTGGTGAILNTNFPIQIGTEPSDPVTLASFVAEAIGGVVRLAWVTESEVDNAEWLVERRDVSAASNTLFEQIHRVDGAGSTSRRTEYEFIDRDVVPGGRYDYRLTDISRSGLSTSYDVSEVLVGIPSGVTLSQAQPNPANPQTIWTYSLPVEQSVRLAVYNLRGKQVRLLQSRRMPAGSHQALWDISDDAGRSMASGVYLCVLETPTARLVSRVTVLR